jgi:integrase
MGATYTRRGDRGTWLVTVTANRQRERIKVATEQDAKDLVRYIHKAELAGQNIIEAIRSARQPAPAPIATTLPRLRDVLPGWLERQAAAGEIRESTARTYGKRLHRWCYPHALADGRLLGDVPADAVTREMLGAMIRTIREAGRSLAIIEGVRNPLRSYFADLIETKALAGTNPAADLKHFVGKGAHRKAKARRRVNAGVYFTPEEGPQLAATAKALCPRWAPFILTGLLAGLRWGESAALQRSDIDFRRGYLTVERTVSDRGHRIEPCKDGDSRRVKASPALLAALKAHVEAMALEGSVRGWTPEQRQLVFPTAYGHVVRYPYFLEHVWQPLLAKAGLPYRRYHATRHTYATWLLEDGADLRWVQAQMGHATIGQTADTYGHVTPERHEAAAAGLDRYLSLWRAAETCATEVDATALTATDLMI